MFYEKETVLGSINISTLAEELLPEGKRRGDEWTSLCPFHDERNPSFAVNLLTGLFKCLGCGDSGDILSLYSRMKDLSFPLAVNELGGRFVSGIHPTNGNGNGKPSSPKYEKPSPPPLPESTVSDLVGNMRLESYGWLSKNREISKAVAERYQIGKRESGNQTRFSIPIRDDAGKVMNIRLWLPPFGAYQDPERRKEEGKILSWIDGAEGRGLARLFPLDQLQVGRIVICEGEMDALALISIGVPAITGTAGALTWREEWSIQFKGKTVTLCYDNDEEGRAGAAKVARSLQASGAKVFILVWPTDREEKHDATDEIKRSAESMRELIEQAPQWGPDHPYWKQSEGEPKAENIETWLNPERLPDGLLPVPSLSEAMLPEPFRPWLSDIAERFNCALEFPSIGAIVALSAIVGRRVGIRPKRHDDWQVVPNLWGCIVGRPGVLKTPALEEALKPIKRLEAEARERFQGEARDIEFNKIRRKAEKEALEKKIKEAVSAGKDPSFLRSQLDMSEDKDPTPRRYIVNDATVEKLAELLNENPNGLLHFRDELTGWLRTLDKEGHENDKAFHLEAWNGTGSYTSDRIGRGTTHVEAVCEAMLGGIQPGPLGEYLRSTVRGGAGADGLIQRFQLIVYPNLSGEFINVDRSPNKEARFRAFSLFKKLDSINPAEIGAKIEPPPPSFDGSEISRPGIPFLNFDPEAQALFDEWRKDLEEKIRKGEEHPALEAHLSKYRSLMPSLALLFYLLDLAEGRRAAGVSIRAAMMAAGWCDFLEAHARRIYQCVNDGGISSAHALASKIKAGKISSPFVARDVYRNEWADLSGPKETERAIKILGAAFWVRSEEVQTNGRPRLQYFINPKIWGAVEK